MGGFKSNWKELELLLPKLSRRKLGNAWRVYQSYQKAQKSGDPFHPALPYALSVEPTTSCNLRCPECPSGLRSFTRPTGMLEVGLFQKIIRELENELIYMTLYFQGEPYLNTNFFELVREANDRGIYTNTSTNAHFLDEERAYETVKSGIDRVIISIDGADQESYSSYRVGGSLEKVLQGAKKLIAAKRSLKSKTPFIDFQFLVVGPNEHQIEEVQKMGRKLGVDRVLLKTAQIYDFENGSALIPKNTRYSRYKQESNGKWVIKNALDNNCWKMWHSSVITWDGRVVPCCFDKDASHVMGNMSTENFSDIWNGPQYRQFRSALLSSRSEIDICKNCSEGTKVWA